MINRIIRKSGVKVPRDFTANRIKSLSTFLQKFIEHSPTNPSHKNILLVRNAESVGDEEELIYGSLDFGLSKRGSIE